MSWSYDPTALNDNPKDQIRLKIGDTDPSEHFLEDEEILYHLQESQGNITRAAYLSVSVLITRLCNTPDYTLGPYSESNANRLKAFRSVKNELSVSLFGYNAPMSETPTTEPIFSYDMMSSSCCDRKEDSNE